MTDGDGSAAGDAELVHLTLPALPRFLRVARVVAASLANDTGADIDALDDVRLAVGEACSLAVTAGAAHIDLAFAVSDGTLVVTGNAASPTNEVDAEGVLLASQILGVAASSHSLECEPDRIAFTLEFRRGR